MAEIQSEGLIVMWKNLKDNAGTLALALGDSGLLGIFKGLIAVMRVGVKAVTVTLENSFIQLINNVLIFNGVLYASIATFVLFGKTVFGTAMLTGLATFSASVWTAVLSLRSFSTAATMATTAMAGFTKALLIFGPFVAWIAALGTLYILYTRLTGASERITGALKKEIVQLEKISGAYTSYSKGLDELEKKQKRGEDITDDYAAAISRLRKDFPELVANVDLGTISISELNTEIKNANRLIDENKIEKLVGVFKNIKNVKNIRTVTELIAEIADAEFGGDFGSLTAEQLVRQEKTLSQIVAHVIDYGDKYKLSAAEIKNYTKEMLANVNVSEVQADSILASVTSVLAQTEQMSKRLKRDIATSQLLAMPEIDTKSLVKAYELSERSLLAVIEKASKRDTESAIEAAKKSVELQELLSYDLGKIRVDAIKKYAVDEGKVRDLSDKEILTQQRNFLGLFQKNTTQIYTDSKAKLKIYLTTKKAELDADLKS